METMAFLGCSRGLGRQVCLELHRSQQVDQSLLVARNAMDLESLAQEVSAENKVFPFDLSQPNQIPHLLDEILEVQAKRVFYFAGGGPYGHYGDKQWKDHKWALQVSFLTPAEMLHRLLTESRFSFVEQIVFVGSLIADCKGDPKAASYASAKHGLKGLVDSILAEGCDKDLRLFRPGYMDTSLLPDGAAPRLQGAPLLDPQPAAKAFVQWALDPNGSAVFDYSR